MARDVKKLTAMAGLTAVALIVFIIEAQVPLPLPIPGAKLGLANAVTLFALFYGKGEKLSLTATDTFMILICRIVLGAAFTGRFIAFALSVSGGLLAFAAQAAMKRFVSPGQIWACGAVGAVAHNIGQIAAAALLIGNIGIAALLPGLIAAGLLAGAITGLAAQLTLARIKRA